LTVLTISAGQGGQRAFRRHGDFSEQKAACDQDRAYVFAHVRVLTHVAGFRESSRSAGFENVDLRVCDRAVPAVRADYSRPDFAFTRWQAKLE
jgi:hypothetical protein